MMKSVVICGSIDKEGLLVGPLRNNRDIARNRWEFKLVSLTLTAKTEDISGVFEIGCSLNCSDSYDYENLRYQTKNTTLCVRDISISKNERVTYEFTDSHCPYFPVENVKDRLEISLTRVGTNSSLPKHSADFVCHILIRRLS